jgi:hypothetical protein
MSYGIKDKFYDTSKEVDIQSIATSKPFSKGISYEDSNLIDGLASSK